MTIQEKLILKGLAGKKVVDMIEHAQAYLKENPGDYEGLQQVLQATKPDQL